MNYIEIGKHILCYYFCRAVTVIGRCFIRKVLRLSFAHLFRVKSVFRIGRLTVHRIFGFGISLFFI